MPKKLKRNALTPKRSKSASASDASLHHPCSEGTKPHVENSTTDEYNLSVKNGYYDVLFLNEKNQVAEASRNNLFIQKNGILYTPPITSGALPGVLRESLLTDTSRQVKEKILQLKDLQTAERIFLGNSVRGLVAVSLETSRE